MAQAVERTWSWEFDLPAEALWPVLADTARFNQAAGFPRYELIETPREDGSVQRIGTARLGPLRLAWEEGDFDFVDALRVHRIGHRKLVPAATVKAGRIYGSASIPVVHAQR